METKNTSHAPRQYIIDGRKWWFSKELPKYNLWYADYYCSDGDGVELYIEKDGGGFQLECFSGIPASHIYIDNVDFGVFQYAPNKIEDLDFREPVELQCIRIADFLCRKFCEYSGECIEKDSEKN